MHDPYDRSGKWLIGHRGASVLRLAGLERMRSCRPALAEVTHPRQLPDGLLEVVFEDHVDLDLFLVEVATYPDQRVRGQLVRDVCIVYLDKRVLPEVLTLVLHPRGNVEVGNTEELNSRLGWTGLEVKWRVVEMWKLSAEQLLAANDVGLIPWVPLAHYDGPADVVLQECRARIDAQAPPEEHANLLAVTQVMTRLRYNDPTYLAFFGGKQAMIDSPLIQEYFGEEIAAAAAAAAAKARAEERATATADTKRKVLQRFLKSRFGEIEPEMASTIQAIQDENKLDDLIDWAGCCLNLEEFRSRLA